MLMSASSEFITLCRSQVTLLAQGLGAALSVVYLTEELVEEGTAQNKLVPVVAYPEAVVRQNSEVGALLPEKVGDDSQPQSVVETLPEAPNGVTLPRLQEKAFAINPAAEQAEAAAHSLVPSTQIVLPLMHDGVLMGLLVTSRRDRPWNQQERREIERIAQTLALARLLDRRREWFEQQLQRQQRLQAKQRDLLDNLLHQFRNPLTALRTFGKLLLKRLLPGDANRAVADNIVRESDRLQELLQQFDRVIELTADDLEPTKSLPPTTLPATPQTLPLLPNAVESDESCSVADVLAPLLASATAIAQERGLVVVADIPSNLPSVKANAKALREVLSNLIDNALKYTPTGGKIYLQAGRERDGWQGVAISDTGRGIPPADLEQIFTRHYRGIQAKSDIPGTGLGLAIAKDLVEQMQGEIEVFSPAQLPEGVARAGGATFIVWLPVD